MAKTTFQMLVDVKTRGENGIRKLGNTMQGVEGKAKNLAMSFKGIAGPLAAIAGLSAGAALAGIFGATAELQSQTRSLEVLTGSAEKTKKILAEIKAFGAVTPFQVKDLVDVTKKLKAFGIETDSLVGTTKRLADVAGATGAELDGIATAFGQIRAKGKFAQEENLQLLERGVDLTGELKKMYRLSGDELAKAMTKGQIGFEAANIALIKLTNDGGQYFNGAAAQADTLNGKVSTLQDAFVTLGQNIGKVLEPIFKGTIEFVTFLTNSINNLFRNAELQSQAMKNLGFDKLGASSRFRGRKGTERRQALEAEVERLRSEGFGKKPTVDLTPPPLLLGGGPSGNKTADVVVKEQAQASDALLEVTKQINAEKIKGNAFTLARLDYDKSILKIQEDSLEGNNKEIALSNAKSELNEKLLGLFGAQVDRTGKLNTEVKKTNGLFESMKDTVAIGLANAIEGLIAGTKTLGQSLSGVLKQLGSLFLQAGAKSLIGSIFPSAKGNVFAQNGIVPYAKGGYIGRPTMALMGEAGPEAVLPLRRGAGGRLGVESSGGGASNVVVNVDASGSNVEGDAEQSQMLGKAIGIAVQQELIKQQRPGGLLR